MRELRIVAVPGGVEGDEAVLRVLIVPRLDETGLVADSSMADWPDQLTQLNFAVRARPDYNSADVEVESTPDIRADLRTWESFFGRAHGVVIRPPVLPAYTVSQAEPLTDHATHIDQGYTDAAKAMASPGGPASPAAAAAVASTIAGVAVRRTRPTASAPATAVAADAEPPDFHQVITMLREHPRVLRALGLVVDLRIKLTDLAQAGITSRGQICVRPANLAGVRTPWTAFELNAERFLPESTNWISSGMLTLDRAGLPGASGNASWSITTVDVDGAVERLGQAAEPGPTPDRAGQPGELPTLRTAGVVLLHNDVTAHADERTARARDRVDVDLDEEVLNADHLTVGYRIDVKRGGNQWRSLHHRRAKYTVLHPEEGEHTISDRAEENHVKAFAGVLVGEDVVQADEVVARWSGWSLALEQPDLTGTASRREVRRANTGYDFDFRFDPGEDPLPELRFGSRYRVRARAVDLAGGGLRHDGVDGVDGASGEIMFRRYEPVAPPRLTLPAVPVVGGVAAPHPGESSARLVIRSDPAMGLDVDAFAAGAGGLPTEREVTLRPPVASFEIAERHGFLDGADEHTWNIARRAIPSRRTEEFADGGLADPAAGGVAAFIGAAPGGLAADMVDDRNWNKPWPNPGEKTARLLGVDGPFGGPTRLKWSEDGKRLDVLLRPAAEATLELSSTIRDEPRSLLAHFEVQRWLGNNPPASVSGGRHPMVTPPTRLELVHAVRKPLVEPSGVLEPRKPVAGDTAHVLALLPPRPRASDDGALFLPEPEPTVLVIPGASDDIAHLLDGPDPIVDTASTARLDVAASWTEWRDDPSAGPPERVTVELAPVQQIALERGPLPDLQIRHELHDTRRRDVTYTLTAVSRFRDCFDPHDPAEAFLRTGTIQPEDVLRSTAQPPVPVVDACVPGFVWSSLYYGDLGGHVASETRAGGRLRVRLARPWYVSGEGEQLGVLVAPDGVEPGDNLAPYVSWVARDPISSSGSASEPPFMAPEPWLRASQIGAAAGPPVRIKLAEAGGHEVMLVPVDVFFSDDAWWADVDIADAAKAHYAPFAQLALVRYQSKSCKPEFEVSPVVRTDIVNVLPNRDVWVTRTESTATVTLSGLADPDVASRVQVQLETRVGDGPSDLTLLVRDDPSLSGWHPEASSVATGALGEPIAVEIPSGSQARVRISEIDPRYERNGTGVPTDVATRPSFVHVVDLPGFWI